MFAEKKRFSTQIAEIVRRMAVEKHVTRTAKKNRRKRGDDDDEETTEDGRHGR
jgi:hypothetical protein